MHPTVLATKRAVAINRVTHAAKAISEHLQLDTALIDGLNPPGKDPQIKELHRLETLAEILEGIAAQQGLVLFPKDPAPSEPIPAPVSLETLPPPILEPEPLPAVPEKHSVPAKHGRKSKA